MVERKNLVDDGHRVNFRTHSAKTYGLCGHTCGQIYIWALWAIIRTDTRHCGQIYGQCGKTCRWMAEGCREGRERQSELTGEWSS